MLEKEGQATRKGLEYLRNRGKPRERDQSTYFKNRSKPLERNDSIPGTGASRPKCAKVFEKQGANRKKGLKYVKHRNKPL